MSIYWSLKSVPELPGGGAESMSIVFSIISSVRRPLHEASRLFLAALFTAFIFLFLGVSMPWFGLPKSFWYIPVSAMVGFGIGRFVLSRIAIPVLRPFYRELVERDIREPAPNEKR